MVALFGVVGLHEGFLRSLSEAIFLAATLTVTVDPFLKRRLQREAAQDIFHHLLGIDFPVEIRDAFKKSLFDHDTYRQDAYIEATATKSSEDSVILDVAIRWTVVAVRKTHYQQYMEFEESEQGSILQASVTVESNEKASYSQNNPTLTRKTDEPMVLEWKANKKIEMGEKESVSAYLKFTVRRRVNDFWTFNFLSPAINPHVRINSGDDLDIYASHAHQVIGNEYLYKKVFLPGDHIQVRWKPKPGPAATEALERTTHDLSAPPPSRV